MSDRFFSRTYGSKREMVKQLTNGCLNADGQTRADYNYSAARFVYTLQKTAAEVAKLFNAKYVF
jgi:hypothetical protein